MIPEEDTFPEGTVVRYLRREASEPSVAIKVNDTAWRTTDVAPSGETWDILVKYWETGLEYLEVAPDDWPSLLEKPKPGLDLTQVRGNWELTDFESGRSWLLIDGEWVRR
jgi:hypothetical protein